MGRMFAASNVQLVSATDLLCTAYYDWLEESTHGSEKKATMHNSPDHNKLQLSHDPTQLWISIVLIEELSLQPLA